MKSRVTLVQKIDTEPYYLVEYYSDNGRHGHWATAKIFSFRPGSEEPLWSQENSLQQAMDLAKRFEDANELEKEIIIYETPDKK